MDISLSIGNAAVLFAIMLVGALTPGVSVLTVASRTATYGLRHGVLTTLGIATGDILFILIALFGLAVAAERVSGLLVWIKYFGAAYLIWLGAALWRAKPGAPGESRAVSASLSASFMLGLLITLADQKAILFYMGFLPAFVDLGRVTPLDACVIVALAIVAISSKLIYIVLIERVGQFVVQPDTVKYLNRFAGTVMIGLGVFLLVKT